MAHRDRLLKSRLREVFVITLDDGSAWKGLLYAVDDRSLILRDAEALTSEQPGVPVDGELVLPRDRVAYMQRP